MGDYKRKRRSRRHHNKLSENESDDDDEDEDDDDDDIDDDEDDFEVDANGLIVDPETERKKELKRRRMLKRRENDQESDDDIGDEGKGYLNDPKLKGDGTQFVVLNDTAYYEQQKEKERIKAIQIEQQRQELERQRLHQQQLQMQHQAQQYALQQQQQQQQAMNTYYNGMNNGLTAHQFGAANVNNAQFNGFNVQSNDVQIVQNVDANYYQTQQQQTQHDVIQMNHNQNVQYVQQPIAQNQSVPIVEEKKVKKKRSRKK